MEQVTDRLTKGQKWTIAVTLIIFVLSGAGHLLIRKWYSVDLRYKEGAYYILENSAVTSCEVKNYGHITANSIRIRADFDSKLLDLQVSGAKYEKLEGGIEQNNVTTQLDRIVAGSKATVFYATEKAQDERFVKLVECQEGLGKTGEPIFWRNLLTATISIFCGLAGALLLGTGLSKIRKNLEESKNLLEKSRKYVQDTAQEGERHLQNAERSLQNAEAILEEAKRALGQIKKKSKKS